MNEKKRTEDLEAQIVDMTLQYNNCLRKTKSLEQTIVYLKSQKCLQNFPLDHIYDRGEPTEHKKAVNIVTADHMTSSFTFQVGDIFVKGIKKPGKNTVYMPFRMIKLFWCYIKRGRKY